MVTTKASRKAKRMSYGKGSNSGGSVKGADSGSVKGTDSGYVKDSEFDSGSVKAETSSACSNYSTTTRLPSIMKTRWVKSAKEAEVTTIRGNKTIVAADDGAKVATVRYIKKGDVIPNVALARNGREVGRKLIKWTRKSPIPACSYSYGHVSFFVEGRSASKAGLPRVMY
jgi:hypothetical protein